MTAKRTDTSAPLLTADSEGPLPLPARDAYRLWAPKYQAETAVSALDDLAVAELAPLPAGTLLDAGCGTGRRLPPGDSGELVVGVDLVSEMLAAGRRRGETSKLAAADLRALPFGPGCFNTIWCRLVLAHIPDLRPAYEEFSRVAKPGARLVITDFHAEALAAGHTRTFRDASGKLYAVETHPHRVEDHQLAGRNSGFRTERVRDWRVGPEIKPFYEAAGSMVEYQRQRGMALLLALSFVK